MQKCLVVVDFTPTHEFFNLMAIFVSRPPAQVEASRSLTAGHVRSRGSGPWKCGPGRSRPVASLRMGRGPSHRSPAAATVCTAVTAATARTAVPWAVTARTAAGHVRSRRYGRVSAVALIAARPPAAAAVCTAQRSLRTSRLARIGAAPRHRRLSAVIAGVSVQLTLVVRTVPWLEATVRVVIAVIAANVGTRTYSRRGSA